jgi:hypothetical protein
MAVHLGRNIRQTTRKLGETHACKPLIAFSRVRKAKVSTIETHDVGADCALYMIP